MTAEAAPSAYRVLARKYRPTRLSELIGQEAVVRTLSNAFASGRIAHAFLLSGIRGVGKTTTARIIARALNCTGPNGSGGPTPEPCGVCPSCQGIAEDRQLDVIEMDAATRTGIDDIREIVDSVRYAPSASRYKVYIIDEVHMLSEKAFNGLLKTLEEPPPHAKFVFATTEVRKVPVTVLSRCQRFDLRRVEPAVIETHLAAVCGREAVDAEPGALRLVATAAEGSVRDSLSLLDQAIALSPGPVTAAIVQDMLGLADRRRLLDLFEAVLMGNGRAVLEGFADLHALGADPAAVLHDLLALAHELSRLKTGATHAPGVVVGPELESRLEAVAEVRSLAVLARVWQILLKGLEEVRTAPDAAAAAEMVLLRVACVGDVPPPGELARLIREVGGGASVRSEFVPATAGAPQAPPHKAGAPQDPPHKGNHPVEQPLPEFGESPGSGNSPERDEPPEVLVQLPASAPSFPAEPASFDALIELLGRNGEQPLAAFLEETARVIRFAPGDVELCRTAGLPHDAPSRLAEAATRITGRRWVVAVGQAPGEPTIAERRRARRQTRIEELVGDGSIRRLLDAFPGAEIVDVRPAASEPAARPRDVPLSPRTSEVERA